MARVKAKPTSTTTRIRKLTAARLKQVSRRAFHPDVGAKTVPEAAREAMGARPLERQDEDDNVAVPDVHVPADDDDQEGDQEEKRQGGDRPVSPEYDEEKVPPKPATRGAKVRSAERPRARARECGRG